MASETCPGRLIAVDGISGAAMIAGAKWLRDSSKDDPAPGISLWDASSIFYELRRTDPNVGKPTVRTLLLLYASDLVFRLRWEIRPALEQGRSIIAAPYVETAIAIGRAAGVPRRWLACLFEFAPKAQAAYRVPESIDHPRGVEDDFFGFFSAAFERTRPAELQQTMRDYLEALERRGRCHLIPTKQRATTAGGPRR